MTSSTSSNVEPVGRLPVGEHDEDRLEVRDRAPAGPRASCSPSTMPSYIAVPPPGLEVLGDRRVPRLLVEVELGDVEPLRGDVVELHDADLGLRLDELAGRQHRLLHRLDPLALHRAAHVDDEHRGDGPAAVLLVLPDVLHLDQRRPRRHLDGRVERRRIEPVLGGQTPGTRAARRTRRTLRAPRTATADRSPTAYSGLSWRTPNGMNWYPDWSDSVFEYVCHSMTNVSSVPVSFSTESRICSVVKRHERHLPLELFEHARDVGRRQPVGVALGDAVEHGEQEVQPGARGERIGVAHHEVAGDHGVDEHLRRQLAVRGLAAPRRCRPSSRCRRRWSTVLLLDLGQRLELARHLDPQLVRRRERLRAAPRRGR